MAVTLTYDNDLGRIEIDATLLGASATYAHIDRTTDGINYTTVRGGSAIEVTSQAMQTWYDYEFPTQLTTYRVRSYSALDVLQATQTANTTQTLDSAWLKSIENPYLNRAINLFAGSEISRSSRSGTFYVIGRTTPVHVGEKQSSRSLTIEVLTETIAERDEMDYLLASGGTYYLHTPADHRVPTMYVSVGGYSQRRYSQSVSGTRYMTTIALTEVAQPDSSIVGYTVTYGIAALNFATYADAEAAFATYGAAEQFVADPEEVIVD